LNCSGCEVDHGGEASVGLVASHGDALELLEFAEEVFDEMAPFVDVGVDLKRLAASRMLGDDDRRAALVEFFDDPVGVEGLVGDQPAKLDVLDQRREADRIVALAGEEFEADEVAEGVGESEDFGRQAAFRLADGLALSPPFAPWPWR
jgi:hypothetical protein